MKDPTDKNQNAYIGLLLALAGLAHLIMMGVFSLFVLFFGALLMCGNTFFMVPFSLGAIIMGWKGRKEKPVVAWIAIAIGLSLVPLSLVLTAIYGELLYKATA